MIDFKDFQDSLQGPKIHPKIIKDLTMPMCSSLVDIWISFKPFTPDCLLHNFYDVGLKKLALDQLIIP